MKGRRKKGLSFLPQMADNKTAEATTAPADDTAAAAAAAAGAAAAESKPKTAAELAIEAKKKR